MYSKATIKTQCLYLKMAESLNISNHKNNYIPDFKKVALFISL